MVLSLTIQMRSTLLSLWNAREILVAMVLKRAKFFFLFLLLPFFSLFAEEEKKVEQPKIEHEEGYTINYNTVSIVEYLKFASKICNVNFIFNEEELDFTVSVVSDAPITPQNVMATLVQVLRIQGFTLLEQGNSLVIHNSGDVRQIARIVTESGQEEGAPIVTRVFRIKNTGIDSLAGIIQPMISSSAILESSPETRQLILTDVTANVNKVAALIEILDAPYAPLEIRNFETQYNSPDYLIGLATQIMTPLAQGNPIILVPQNLAHSIYIVSTPELVEKATAVLLSLDVPPKEGGPSSFDALGEGGHFFIYHPQSRTAGEVEKALLEIAENLKKTKGADPMLIQVIESAKVNPTTNTLVFSGEEKAIAKVKELLATIDASSGKFSRVGGRSDFLIYKPKNVRGEHLVRALREITENLKSEELTDPSLLYALQSMKWIKTSNSLLFTGEPSSIKKVEEIIATVDLPGSVQIAEDKTFFLYQPQHATRYQTECYLKQILDNLHKKGEEGLVHAIRSMKWIEASQSLMFHGNEPSLARLKELLVSFDTPNAAPVKAFFIYAVQYAPLEKIDSYLEKVACNLEKTGGDHHLVEAIDSRKRIEESRSFMFQGTETAIAQLKELLKNFDTLEEAPKKGKSGYFLYKIQNTTGDIIEEDLENLAKNFKSSEYKNPHILDVIEHTRYIKETNSLLLTGDPEAIEEVKKIIAEYDYPRGERGPIPNQFFMYKPQQASAEAIQKSLKEIAANFKKADLADPSLLAAIDSVKYVDATNSLIFTGSAEALEKIKILLKEVDVPPKQLCPIHRVGKTTFLLYKLKYADGPQIITSLKTMVSNLKKSSACDSDLISTLSSVKYVKETNSLLFTGTEESLSKVQALVEQFDVTSLGKPSKAPIPKAGAPNFFVYKPQSLSGPELEKILQEFAENLKMSGLSDPELFHTIDSMRFIEKTSSLVFTGTPKALDQVKELLRNFDIPSNLAAGPLPGGPLEPSIQAIDNTSFLVYKLQFHKGDEIQGALRQIAKDLTLSNASINQNLLNSINSIQWLEVTNSLLCSGDQETLTRLRELIKNLDIPLKQVFIEMLVLETNLSNALNFGLEWGGNYKYRDKFGGTLFNSLPFTTTDDSPDNFVTHLSALNPASGGTPTPIGAFNPRNGFDLGVIGEVIKHNGNTFLTLGSLLTAIQSDSETSVIMTPKIITQDGRTSTIFVGQNVPFTGSFVNTAGASSIQTANLEYRDIGLNLTVTPVLGNSDVVTLDISLDRTIQSTDSAGNTIQVGDFTGQAPTTSKTTMQTTVHVPDKHFLVLSGFVNNSNQKVKAGIPCLGGLPIIGAAFSKSNETISNNNIVIFLRPHIITSLDDMQQLSNDQEEYFRDQAGTPYLEHNYNEGMELIKSVDDE